MRVISGRFKGRRLVSFEAGHVRPTTDRVKESIFNSLQSDIDGARVLDLFAGTGNLAIESVSRGAVDVTAVEVNKKSIQVIKKNLATLDIESEISLIQDDVFRFLKNYSGSAFEIVFIDPPFTEKLGHSVMEAMGASKVAAEGTCVIIETGLKERIEDSYPGFVLENRKDFGDKVVSRFRGVSKA